MARWKLPAELTSWIGELSQPLHAGLAWRLLPLVAGMVLASGRGTVASWLRAGNLGLDFKAFNYFLGSLGRRTEWIAGQLLCLLAERLPLGDVLVFALDDTPPSVPVRMSRVPAFTTTRHPGQRIRSSPMTTSGSRSLGWSNTRAGESLACHCVPSCTSLATSSIVEIQPDAAGIRPGPKPTAISSNRDPIDRWPGCTLIPHPRPERAFLNNSAEFLAVRSWPA